MSTADGWETCPHCEHFIDWHVGDTAKGFVCRNCGCTINHRIEKIEPDTRSPLIVALDEALERERRKE